MRTLQQTVQQTASILIVIAVAACAVHPLSGSEPTGDWELIREIGISLKHDQAVASHLIDVASDRGVVTLSGSVDNLLARRHAVRRVRSLKGVLGVIDRLQVRPVEVTDKDLQQHVVAALKSDPATDEHNIIASVKVGVVRLQGSVPAYAERRLCWEAAAGVAGVRDVVDDMQIVYKTKRPDSQILADIQAEYRDNVWLDEGRIKVSVKDGRVKLHGIVETSEEQFQAEMDAFVDGVTHVDFIGLIVRPRLGGSTHQTSSVRNKSEIDRELKREFDKDPRVANSGIEFEVRNGVVTLNGQVGSYAAKLSAGQDAADVPGVFGVENLLRVRPAKLRPDGDVTQDVRAALARDAYLHRHDIHVFTLNSQVFLRGEVHSRYERLRAEDVAARVKGVVDVTNGLTAHLAQHGPADSEIEKAIRRQLKLNPLLASKTVRVLVKNGEALLTGRVFDWREQRAATRSAFQGGAQEVIDNLEVLHGPDVLRQDSGGN